MPASKVYYVTKTINYVIIKFYGKKKKALLLYSTTTVTRRQKLPLPKWKYIFVPTLQLYIPYYTICLHVSTAPASPLTSPSSTFHTTSLVPHAGCLALPAQCRRKAALEGYGRMHHGRLGSRNADVERCRRMHRGKATMKR